MGIKTYKKIGKTEKEIEAYPTRNSFKIKSILLNMPFKWLAKILIANK